MKKNSLTSKKFHFRSPIFVNQRYQPSKSYNLVDEKIDSEQNVYEFFLELDDAAPLISELSPAGDSRPKNVKTTVEILDENSARIQFLDETNDRFVVPVPVTGRKMDTNLKNVNFVIERIESPFSLKISRKDDGQVLFDTGVGPILFYRQLIQAGFKSDFFNSQEYQYFIF